jgi:2-polyprenyl-3-methyl-5-hydroxy-6-metoxy-1,4-benzoquinol methylase
LNSPGSRPKRQREWEASIGPGDVVVLFDVMEHLTDPFESLDRCAKQLSHEGIIVLATKISALS